MIKLLITTLTLFSINTSASSYLVKLKDISKKSKLNIRSLGQNFPHLYSIEFYNKSKSSIEKELSENKNILYFERNKKIRLPKLKSEYPLHNIAKNNTPLTNDPLLYQQWAINNPNTYRNSLYKVDLDAKNAWTITEGSKDIKIAILDTGIDYNHVDLKENIFVNKLEENGIAGIDDDGNGFIDDVYGYDFVHNQGNGLDENGHGTHVAGIIGAIKNNNIGIAGIMPNVSLIPIKFLDKYGAGDIAGAIKAIDYAITMNVDIMNNSWALEETSKLLYEAVKRAKERGIFFVVAAGNYSIDLDQSNIYPAIFSRTLDNVITVASHDYMSNLSDFSDHGKNTVLLAAPGDNITSTFLNNRYETFSGTSMAAPYVTGSIGLYLSLYGKVGLREMKKLLKTTTIPSANLRSVKSIGRLNTYTLLTHQKQTRPSQSLWKTLKLDVPFETTHPYKHGIFKSREFKVKGAKFIRVLIKRYDLDEGFDELTIVAPPNVPFGRRVIDLTGQGKDYISEYTEGDSIRVKYETGFTSKNNWGILIEEIQYID